MQTFSFIHNGSTITVIFIDRADITDVIDIKDAQGTRIVDNDVELLDAFEAARERDHALSMALDAEADMIAGSDVVGGWF